MTSLSSLSHTQTDLSLSLRFVWSKYLIIIEIQSLIRVNNKKIIIDIIYSFRVRYLFHEIEYLE